MKMLMPTQVIVITTKKKKLRWDRELWFEFESMFVIYTRLWLGVDFCVKISLKTLQRKPNCFPIKAGLSKWLVSKVLLSEAAQLY